MSELWRHKKTGGIYTVLGPATGQAEVPGAYQAMEYAALVVYRAEKDGRLWVRPSKEFDMKFERTGKDQPGG